ncbi:DUF4917 family protein [Luteimonas rhizosphaerae]|uniref:DUF4917 family protein n=2 Tax=Luteimonas TaxID=83614 RepID=UPI000C7B11A7|nr:DUF4917 family protein [Luteimonas sp. 4-12]
MPLMSFDEAVARSSDHRHVLMGNGFSIALRPEIFSYQALIDRAKIDELAGGREVFTALDTTDFEAVIRAAVDAAKLVQIFDGSSPISAQLDELASGLREKLVQAIAGSHPPHPFEVSEDQYRACRRFLGLFKRRYTLNYDLLLYWALMRTEIDDLQLESDDGFRDSPWEEDANYVSWIEHHSATVVYLHGAVHLFDAGHELIKYTWSRTQIPLMDQIRVALEQEKYPLFVAEGSTRQKFEKIVHSAYLHRAYRSFSSIEGDLFIYGHSLKSNDQHIYDAISEGRISSIYVSVYGDENSQANQEIMRSAEQISSMRRGRRPLNVHFFDAASARVWG